MYCLWTYSLVTKTREDNLKITLEYDLSDIASSQGIDWDSLTLKQKNEIVSSVTFSVDAAVADYFKDIYKRVS